MALRAKKGEIPENSFVFTKSEAIKYQWQQIAEWTPRREVWPFIQGIGFLGGAAALSGMYINFKIRKAMKMPDFGKVASTLTSSLCPGVMVCVMQIKYVTEKLFLPNDSCPICIELRSVVVQNANAIAYPLILSSITNFMLSIRGQTHRIPHYKSVRELSRFCGYLVKPVLPSLAVIGLANTLAASFIVYKQFNCLSHMRQILSLENESDENERIGNNFF
ncbi:hypothetical protein KPH14_003431 [Odynerus spinipes]|uniref:Uncharacterized protein n=1 Tax=Odynerus spinipes TaxID=1348599 RepID=A0AAD9RCR9_9HYME|nr:hypothetical protein KPH14_003431 [Odynerus spinipes]